MQRSRRVDLAVPVTRTEFISSVAASYFWNSMARPECERVPLTKQTSFELLISCLVNRQIPWQKSMSLVSEMKMRTGYQDALLMFSELTPEQIKGYMFQPPSLHRYHYMSDLTHECAVKVRDELSGDVRNLWMRDEPTGSQLLQRLTRTFRGIGVKTGSLFCRIAVLGHNVQLWDKYASLDASPDVRVTRVMYRLGLVRKDATQREVIEKARELSPMCAVEIDGMFCIADWCTARAPRCKGDESGEPCPLFAACPSREARVPHT